MEAASAGLGVAIGSWPFVAQDIAAGRLIAPFGFIAAHSRYVLLSPLGKTDRDVALFRDWLTAEGQAMPLPPLSPRPAPGP